jgi:hypothetical protein
MVYTLEDYLIRLHQGQWFGFNNLNGDDANKTYANLVIHSEDAKPSESDCTNGVAQLQADYDTNEYARKRKAEYPTIEELVVALYDTEDKSAIEAKRAEVKAKYPKP